MEILNLLTESLMDNKKLIIGLYILFIIFFVLAWVLSGSIMEGAMAKIPASNATAPGMSGDDVVDIFIHNAWGGVVSYVASIFFGIPAVLILIYNGINLGFFGQMFDQLVPNGGLKFIVYLIPHGIFEITATVIQSAAGVLLFLFIWRFIKAWRSSETDGASDAFEKTKKILIQSLVLMVFATVLILIAAPIEAYFSVPFSEFIVGT